MGPLSIIGADRRSGTLGREVAIRRKMKRSAQEISLRHLQVIYIERPSTQLEGSALFG